MFNFSWMEAKKPSKYLTWQSTPEFFFMGDVSGLNWNGVLFVCKLLAQVLSDPSADEIFYEGSTLALMKAAVSPDRSSPTFLYNFPDMVHWRYASMACHAGYQLDLGFLESWTLFLRQQITDGLKGTGLVWVVGSMFCWILVKPRNVLMTRIGEKMISSENKKGKESCHCTP